MNGTVHVPTLIPEGSSPVPTHPLLEEPEPYGDLVDILILRALVVLFVLTVGALLLFMDSVWDAVGLGEGSNPPE